jgi:hypothetical protein
MGKLFFGLGTSKLFGNEGVDFISFETSNWGGVTCVVGLGVLVIVAGVVWEIKCLMTVGNVDWNCFRGVDVIGGEV